MKTSIYILQDPFTMEVRYVGKSNNPRERLKAHCNPARFKNTHKFNWIKSLRDKNSKPIMTIIDEVDVSEWHFWEQYWIEQFNYWGFNLVNTTRGGDGLTRGNQTSFKEGHSVWLGNNHSEESKRKISENSARRGKIGIGAKKVQQLTLDGELINEFESMKEAADKTKSIHSKVCAVCRGKRKSHNNFKWKYK